MLPAVLLTLAAVMSMDHGVHAGLSGCNMSPVLNNPNKYQICFGDGTCSTFSCGPNRVLSLSECGCVRLQSASINDVTSKSGTLASNANGLDKSTPVAPTGSFVTMAPTTIARTPGGNRVTFAPSFLPKGPVRPLRLDEDDEDREYSQDVRYSHANIDTCMGMYVDCVRSPKNRDVSLFGPPRPPACLPEVYIRAQNNLESAGSYGQISVENNKVVLKNNKAEFDGSGYLKIDFYNGNEFTRGLTVAMTVEEAVETTPRRQVLLSNCYVNVMPSLEIALEPATSTVVFVIDVSSSSAVNVTVPYTPFVPKRLALIYDGNTLTATVDSESRTVPIKGIIEGRLQPLFIGNSQCGNNNGLHGFLDEIRIYRCVQRNVLDIV